jgi:periplasmic divalent cation tolerance protein
MCIISSPVENSEKIANAIITGKLAACVQITSGITSYYWWEGEIRKDGEVLLLIKTHRGLVRQIESLILEIHPYKVPEFIVIPIVDGLPAYLNWIKEVAIKAVR